MNESLEIKNLATFNKMYRNSMLCCYLTKIQDVEMKKLNSFFLISPKQIEGLFGIWCSEFYY